MNIPRRSQVQFISKINKVCEWIHNDVQKLKIVKKTYFTQRKFKYRTEDTNIILLSICVKDYSFERQFHVKNNVISQQS